MNNHLQSTSQWELQGCGRLTDGHPLINIPSGLKCKIIFTF